MRTERAKSVNISDMLCLCLSFIRVTWSRARAVDHLAIDRRAANVSANIIYTAQEFTDYIIFMVTLVDVTGFVLIFISVCSEATCA